MPPLLLTAATLVSFALATQGWTETLATCKLVSRGGDGKLRYTPYTERGDRLPDFSNCGYGGGGVRLPEVPAVVTVAPSPGDEDDLPRLQAAIDELAKRPLNADGFRGALLLRKGHYRLNGTLFLRASGIVLRGEGNGDDGTVLSATLRKQHTLLMVTGEGSPTEVQGTRQRITDPYVPVGAHSFQVADASGFRAGDEVIVHRPSTAEWIHELGMDRIPKSHPKVVQWKPGSKDLRFMRTLVSVQGNRVTLEAPVVNALQREYGGGFLYKYEFPGRIQHVGIENLRCESEFAGKDDEDHGWDAIRFASARHGWVRNVVARHFGYSCVGITSRASNLTVQDCQCLDPVSKLTGGRRYSFHVSGQLNLVQRCYARNGRHDFVMHSVVPGPNVFLHCRAEQAHADSGPHHRWSTGTLYDNLVTDGALNVENRGASGTGHGWAGAQMVFWNCTAKSITCQRPPTAQNFCLGCTGAKRTKKPDGWWECPAAPVAPQSLYLAQLEERLGPQAVTNVSAR